MPHLMESTPAQLYEEALVPRLFRPQAERAVELLALGAAEHVVDVACGTGVGARLAALRIGPHGRVAGVDSDAGMLDAARAATEREFGAVPLEWYHAEAAHLPFGDAVFDACLCLQGLQFFGYRQCALDEITRVLKPGGRLVVSVWSALDRNPGHAAVYAALQEQGLDTASPQRGFELDAAELRSLVERARFDVCHLHAQRLAVTFESTEAFVNAIAGGAPYTRRVLEQLDSAARNDCLESAVRHLRRFAPSTLLTLPTEVIFLHAVR